MSRMISKQFVYTAGIFIALLLTSVGLMRTPETSYQEMLSKYEIGGSATYTSPDGFKLHYALSGDPSNPAILLLHGTSGSLLVYDELVEHLSDDFFVVRFDQVGHGFSGPAPGDSYDIDTYFAAIDALTDHLGCSRFSIVGHSLGGWIAWRYAATHTEKIDRLVLLAASGMPMPEGGDSDPGLGFRLLKTPIGVLLVEHYYPRSLVEKSTLQSVYDPSKATTELVDMYWELGRLPGNRRALALATRRDRETHLADLARDVDARTLLIWGEEDTYLPIEMAQAFNDRIPDMTLLRLPRVGHMAMIEAPEVVGPAIRKFLLEAEAEQGLSSR